MYGLPNDSAMADVVRAEAVIRERPKITTDPKVILSLIPRRR